MKLFKDKKKLAIITAIILSASFLFIASSASAFAKASADKLAESGNGNQERSVSPSFQPLSSLSRTFFEDPTAYYGWVSALGEQKVRDFFEKIIQGIQGLNFFEVPAVRAISCGRCSTVQPCQYATWESGGPTIACDSAQDQKIGVVYSANDSCSAICSSPNVCSSGSCVGLKSCGRCSTVVPCNYATWQVPNNTDCEVGTKYGVVYTTNDSCTALCPTGTCSGGSCFNPPPTCSSAGPDGWTTTATTGTQTVYAYGVNNATSVSFPTWSDVNGQDDIIWYPGTNLGGGTWKADINLASHPGLGSISVHVYLYNNSYSTIWCDTANGSRIALPPPTGLSASCPSPGNSSTLSWAAVAGVTYYALRVDDFIANGWSGLCDGAQNAGDQCLNLSGTSYSFAATPGHSYHWWVHTCNSAGCGNAADGGNYICVAPVSPTCSSAGPDGWTTTATSGTQTVYAYGVNNATAVSFPTWSDVNGQDDIIWYPGTNLGGGTWKADINLASHPGLGSISVHVYLYNNSYSTIWCDTANGSRIALPYHCSRCSTVNNRQWVEFDTTDATCASPAGNPVTTGLNCACLAGDASWYNANYPNVCDQYPMCSVCSPSPWTNQGCGQGGCPADQRYQTRSCTPAGCTSQSQCVADSSCVLAVPTVDLKVNGSDNPPSVNAPATLNITWSTTNSSQLSSCSGTGYNWNGSKSTVSGNDTLTNVPANTYTYSITCNKTAGGTISDSVTVTVTVNSTATYVLDPPSASIVVGSFQSFQGLYDPDGPGGPQGQTYECGTDSSSNTSVAIITSPCWAKCVSVGSATISSVYSGITAQATLTCTATPKPDLVSENLSVNGTPTVGNNLTFSARVRNAGSSATGGQFYSRFCIDNANCLNSNTGQVCGPVINGNTGMSAGAYADLTSQCAWTATLGAHTIYVCADVLKDISESDETNNCALQGFTVVNAPTNSPPTVAPINPATPPDYCVSGPAATFSWTFSDPDAGDSQSAYQVQADNNSDFSSPEVDSGKVNSSSGSYATGPGKLLYNSTYAWRVKVWDASNAESAWAAGSSFSTPQHAYPGIDFSWTPQNPNANETTQFSDQSTVAGGATKSTWLWTIPDANYIGGTNSSSQDPKVKFTSTGAKQVILRVTDSDGYACQASKTVNAQTPLPGWQEVAPQ